MRMEACGVMLRAAELSPAAPRGTPPLTHLPLPNLAHFSNSLCFVPLPLKRCQEGHCELNWWGHEEGSVPSTTCVTSTQNTALITDTSISCLVPERTSGCKNMCNARTINKAMWPKMMCTYQ
uniref:Uncharacterized protein n=1 Tax=Pipistrellus kuhlii TaxID=59472 RepID=A0A7J7UG56_PIPKU|nr:hypothetical protein mPipKuh1_009073 [Pipistrellus kuhlii]